MKEYKFDMQNMSQGKKKNNIVLLRSDNEELFLSLKDDQNVEIQRIKVLNISKIKKLTNFFMRGFNIKLIDATLEDILIPEEDLMEAERKIIVQGEDGEERVKNAMDLLQDKYDASLNREDYQRTMVYMDTQDRQLEKNNMIFRLTQENNDVKATMHMDNNLSGDKKHIIKFFFTNTSMPYVIHFFEESLSLQAITREIISNRIEYKSSFGEVAFDKMSNGNYYVIELELDKFMDESRDSGKVDEVAKKIAEDLDLKDCRIVDQGTEAIHKLQTGRDFFEEYKIQEERIK